MISIINIMITSIIIVIVIIIIVEISRFEIMQTDRNVAIKLQHIHIQ